MTENSEHRFTRDRSPMADLDDTVVQNAAEIESATALSQQQERPPAEVPGYAVLKSLGDGAYGSVWLAREENTGKQVAIKFYTHRRGLDWSLLNREVEKLAVLYTSRNIVGLLGVGWESDPPHYVMEYLENGSLSSLLEDGALPPHETVRIAKSILHALVHAHGCGILHCDLKPANVLLDRNFEPRICDFGQSRLSDEQNPALGTLFYMAAEQADLKAVPDARWDVYAMGALLFQMLTGSAPYRTAENEQLIRSTETLEERLAVYRRILRQSPKPKLRRLASGVDKRLAEIVERCLQIDPQKRYPNAQAILDALELRDRQRSRRPLLALGVLGPALLLLAMLPIARNAMTTTIDQARDNLTERALESDVLSVRLLARGLERELEDRMSELEQIAADPKLRELVEQSASDSWRQRELLFAFLAEHKEKSDTLRETQKREQDTSWFITDAFGFQRWREPPNEKTFDKFWGFRDYFHGLEKELAEDIEPGSVPPIDKPHISLVFRSRATLKYMVAISVPVWDAQRERVIAVLARTTHLGQLLAEYARRIQGTDAGDVNRVIALVDQRDWKLLDHPWMTQDHLQNLPDKVFDQFTLGESVISRIQGLSDSNRSKTAIANDRYEDYEDPVGRVASSAYSGHWLAAFCPIGSTGWTAIVQERRAVALAPVVEMENELTNYALWALLVSCGLIGLLWYFVLRALNDRTLRISNTRNGSRRPTNSLSTISDR